MSIVRRCPKEKLKGGAMLVRTTGAMVEQITGRRQSVQPEGGGDRGMEQVGTNAVIDRTQHMFSTPILLRGVRIGEAKDNAMRSKEGMGCRAVELLTIIGLQAHNGKLKLSANKGMKGNERGQKKDL